VQMHVHLALRSHMIVSMITHEPHRKWVTEGDIFE
jgi:hypothetical protein